MNAPKITPYNLGVWIAEFEGEALRLTIGRLRKRPGAAELAQEYHEASAELKRLAGSVA